MANTLDTIVSKTRGVASGVKARLDGYVGIFAEIVEDHAAVRSLVERVQRDADKRAGLWPKIKTELLAHERAELRELYPVLAQHDATRMWADHHEVEASKLEEKIERLDATPFDEEIWGELFDELARALEHHVREEEDEILPIALAVIGPDKARDLGTAFTATKQRFVASVA